jgi:hypothetical protein
MMRDGVLWEQTIAEHHISGKESGFWPTPVARDDGKTPDAHMRMKRNMAGGARKKITSLTVMIKAIEQGKYREMWPTPRAHDWKGGLPYGTTSGRKESDFYLPDKVNKIGKLKPGGQLNPQWVAWLMGWPIGWTDLKPLAMGKFRSWLQQHGIY